MLSFEHNVLCIVLLLCISGLMLDVLVLDGVFEMDGVGAFLTWKEECCGIGGGGGESGCLLRR